MAHARPFWTSTLQDLSNGIKNTSRRGVLPSAVELWSCRSPRRLPTPTFGSVSLILTLSLKWGCDNRFVVDLTAYQMAEHYLSDAHHYFFNNDNWNGLQPKEGLGGVCPCSTMFQEAHVLTYIASTGLDRVGEDAFMPPIMHAHVFMNSCTLVYICFMAQCD